MVYYVEIASEPNWCFGEPDRSPSRLPWFGSFSAKHRLGKIDDWMREYYPSAVTVAPAEHTLRDVVSTHLGFCVAQKVKDLIESLEPNVHQFLPIHLHYGKETHPYYMMFIGHSRDCYDLAKSDVKWKRFERDGHQLEYWSKKHAVPMVFERSKIGTMHLFQNASGSRMLLMSAKLHDIFESNGITGLRYERQIVV